MKARVWILCIAMIAILGVLCMTAWLSFAFHAGASSPAGSALPSSAPAAIALADKIPAATRPAGHAIPLLHAKNAAKKQDESFACATAVAVDLSGQVWAGMQDGSVYAIDSSGHAVYSFQPDDDGCHDPVTALAVDRHGRIWAGHAVNGVSVFDGRVWRSYGLLDGPLGEHVNKIAISPINGDVWLATNRGLSRYADATASWTYITRAQGLSSDDIASITFDAAGNLFAATADSGVAIAGPADDYAAWTIVRATEDNRGRATGAGLSGDWCSDVCVIGKDVFVGTTAGLSCSRDAGKTWSFVRGVNWINRALLATHPLPEVTRNSPPGVLGDDAVSCLGSDDQGHLLVGHYLVPVDVIDPATLTKIKKLSTETTAAQSITPTPPAYIAASMNGVISLAGQTIVPAESVEADRSERTFAKSAADAGSPAPAKPPTSAMLRALIASVQSLPAPAAEAEVLGTDWVTGGDFWGRYGWDHRNSPYFATSAPYGGIKSYVTVGPHIMPGDGVFTYYGSIDTDNPRSLFFFYKDKREQGEWNDASWKGAYKNNYEGPDLWFRVTVPKGPHRVSIYFINADPEKDTNRARDYLLELKGDAPDPASSDEAPALARLRVRHFEQGFYAQFQVGQGNWWIKANRNTSYVTKASALLVDNLAHRSIDAMMNPDTRPLADSVDLRPRWDGHLDPQSETATAALELWRVLDAARDRDARVDTAYRLLALRALESAPGNASLKAFFRSALPVWTPEDRQQWADKITVAQTQYGKNKPTPKK